MEANRIYDTYPRLLADLPAYHAVALVRDGYVLVRADGKLWNPNGYRVVADHWAVEVSA